MSDNQVYPYEVINNNNNSNDNANYLKNQFNLTQDGIFIVRQTYTYQMNTIQYDNVNKYNGKINKQQNTHNSIIDRKQKLNNKNNKKINNQQNTNKCIIDRKQKPKNKNKKNKLQNNKKLIDIKPPKNNNCDYIITNMKPNTELVPIHKNIYTEYSDDIKKLFGRVEFHMKNDNFYSFYSYWTEILNKFNYIYTIYNGNNGTIDQYTMEMALKELHDKMTSLTKK